MGNGFVKVYSSITRSSIWLEDHPTRLVWITMLCEADPSGVVRASVKGLAHVARVTPEECERALGILCAPDPDSSTSDHEGRRVERVEGGWLLLNYTRYREMRSERQAATAERVRRHRERRKSENVTSNAQSVTETNVTLVRTEEEEEEEEDLNNQAEAENQVNRGGENERSAPPRPPGHDTSSYLAELDALRRSIAAECPEPGRSLVKASRLNARGVRGPEAQAALAEAIEEHGWETVRELFAWGWHKVATGARPPKLQACSLSSGAIGAMLEERARETEAGAATARAAAQRAAERKAPDGPDMTPEQRERAAAAVAKMLAGASDTDATLREVLG